MLRRILVGARRDPSACAVRACHVAVFDGLLRVALRFVLSRCVVSLVLVSVVSVCYSVRHHVCRSRDLSTSASLQSSEG